MNLVILSQNVGEEQGLKWIIESHMNGVNVSFEDWKEDTHCLVIDMELWTLELEEKLLNSNMIWIGLSSDRTFLTAYRALKGKAEDLLFRPFDPMVLVKQLQQIRFQLRNLDANTSLIESHSLTYENFFNEEKITQEIILVAFVTPEYETYSVLLNALNNHPFHGKTKAFAFSEVILMAYWSDNAQACLEECQVFYGAWKRQMDAPLSIFVNNKKWETIKQYYQETRKMTALIFYEGYDIAVIEKGLLKWRPLDPFLTPLEQRIWLEMLEKKDTAAIKKWMENEFLAYERPYPDSEMIRIRLTSVLAQARRYMKSMHLESEQWEQYYHSVFEVIIKGSVVYGIVQTAVNFIVQLVLAAGERQGRSDSSDIEKTCALMEANYWDPDWNLAACAEQLDLNKSTLSRRFHQETGQKFSDALASIRLTEAKRLMKETRLPLDEIAKLSGFANASYFSAVYKRKENVTPSDFRKK